MSLLGFDALGRWALGQLPSHRSLALVTAKGSAALTGQAAAFRVSEFAPAGAFGLAGISARFGTGAPAGFGAVALTGDMLVFKISGIIPSSSWVSTGGASSLALRIPAAGATTSLSAMSLQFATSLGAGRGDIAAAVGSASFTRDFEAWVRRPFGSLAWQTVAAPSPENWSNALPPANGWTDEASPADGWTPATIQTEPWTAE